MRHKAFILISAGVLAGCAASGDRVNPSYSGTQGLIERQSVAAASPVENAVLPKVGKAKSSPDDLFKMAMKEPLSTFSADVDTASYSNLRRALKDGIRPDPAAVRVEEMLNYFSYSLPEPKDGQAFSLTTELSDCPWNKQAKLLRLAIKTPSISQKDRPPCNLVFLVDVSGSMEEERKLPLLKESLRTLVANLRAEDRIAIVTYAGDSGVALPSTPVRERGKILEAIDAMSAGGGTNGASGLELAYHVIAESGTEDTINRVILATDGDFNVGPSSQEEMQQLIEEKRRSGIALSVLGFGGYASNDGTMETLADHGNGNYASIDSLDEANKVLVKEAGSTLVTVAKDVKFQIAFNPLKVEKYRQIGYKNRQLAAQDFDNDKKDAGDLGAGHSVTVVYELIPPKGEVALLKDVFSKEVGTAPKSDQLALVKMRYKAPKDDESVLVEVPILPQSQALAKSTPDHRWAVAVTGFGLTLEGDASAKEISLEAVASLAEGAMGRNSDPSRGEFLDLVRRASELTG